VYALFMMQIRHIKLRRSLYYSWYKILSITLVQLRQNIEQEWAGRALAGGARHRAQDVQCCIIDDARAGLPPAFSRAG
jgi:hypothetical protein